MWFYHWSGVINELLKQFRFGLNYICLVVYSGSAQNLLPWPIIRSSIWCLEEKWNLFTR